MSVLFCLSNALKEKTQEKGSAYDIEDDRSSFASIYRDIGHAIESWPYKVQQMLDIRNWRLKNLFQPDGSFRKPKVYLDIEITSKDNLVLKWFPWPIRHWNLEDTDWLRWSDCRSPSSGMPENRIIMIHEFKCLQEPYERTFRQSEIYLLETLHRLLNQIYEFLSHFLDVVIWSDLYLEYDELQHWSKRTLIRATISRREDIERELEEKRKEKWLKETFERLTITPEDLLRLFKEKDTQVNGVSATLSMKYKVKIGETALKTILATLYREHPVLYDKVLDIPPKGVPSRPIKVVELFPEKSPKKSLL